MFLYVCMYVRMFTREILKGQTLLQYFVFDVGICIVFIYICARIAVLFFDLTRERVDLLEAF